MKNINHISLYNEYFLSSSKNGSSTNTFNLNRCINVIPINTSRNYKIENFHLNINSLDLTFDTNNLQLKNNLRFYLDNDPIFNRLQDSNIFNYYKFNGIVNDTNLLFSAPYISDSSNQNTLISPNRYYNYLEQSNTSAVSNQFLDITQVKTNTKFEIPILSEFSTTFQTNNKNFTYNSNYYKDFYFNSYNYDYIVITPFSFINVPNALSSGFSVYIDFFINFDLIEGDL